VRGTLQLPAGGIGAGHVNVFGAQVMSVLLIQVCIAESRVTRGKNRVWQFVITSSARIETFHVATSHGSRSTRQRSARHAAAV